MIKTHKRDCPICLHKKSILLYIQKFSNQFSHKIVSCLKCGFVYVKNTPPQKFYNEYYTYMSKYEGIRAHEAHENATNKFIDIFTNQNIKKSANILDVGCATGEFLSRFKKRGFKHLYGFDPAPLCKEIAMKKYGIQIETANISSFRSKQKFDFIILSQVLEHLRDVDSSISKLESLLKESG